MWTLMQCLSGPCHVCFGRAKVQTENIIKAAAKVVATAANAKALPGHVLDLQAFGYMGILQRDLWWFVWPFLEGMVRHLHAPGVKACSWGCEGCLSAQLFAMRPVQTVAMLCDRSRARVMHNALFWGQEQLEGCKEECQASRLDANTQAESFNAIQQFEVFHKMCWNWSYWFLEFERPKWLRQRWHGSSQVSTLVLGSCSPAWQRCVAFCCIDIELWPLCWRKRRGRLLRLDLWMLIATHQVFESFCQWQLWTALQGLVLAEKELLYLLLAWLLPKMTRRGAEHSLMKFDAKEFILMILAEFVVRHLLVPKPLPA